MMSMEDLGIDIKLGRTDKRNAIEGRVYLDESFDNIVGLIEKARFGCIPLSWQHVSGYPV